jgi:hypothetical protein
MDLKKFHLLDKQGNLLNSFHTQAPFPAQAVESDEFFKKRFNCHFVPEYPALHEQLFEEIQVPFPEQIVGLDVFFPKQPID